MMEESVKEQVAQYALRFIRPGMTVGLGTGSTSAYFIQLLGERCKKGLQIVGVPTSIASYRLAKSHSIPLFEGFEFPAIDVTVDGADEVNENKELIKGKGGALLREKIIASSTRQLLIIVHKEKMVSIMGKTALLPIEIVPFGYQSTVKLIQSLGLHPCIRMTEDQQRYATDEGNWIVDVDITVLDVKPSLLHKELIAIPGVIETGFFAFQNRTRIIVGSSDGSIQEME